MRALMAPIEPVMPADLLAKAQQGEPLRAVIVGAHRAEILTLAVEAQALGLIVPYLVGLGSELDAAAGQAGVDLSQFYVVRVDDEALLVAEAVRLIHDEDCAMAIKGQVSSDVYLAQFMARSARLLTRTTPSHIFHMSAPGLAKPLLITDAAFTVAPNARKFQRIAANAIGLSHLLGVARPNVAVLSASEKVLPSMPSSGAAAELAGWINQTFGDAAHGFGPVAFDIVASELAAQIKGFEDVGSGDADVVVVPNIETGNGLFKMMVYFLGACAAGIVTGLKVPLVLSSRADAPAARLASIALACIVARAD